MKPFTLFCLCGALVCCGACARPQDGNPPKFHRQENIEKYVQKARSLQQRSALRNQPLAVPALADVSLVQNNPLPPDFDFLPRLLERNRRIIQTRLAQTYAEDAAKRLSSLAEHFRQQAVHTARQAQSPAQLAQQLRALQQEQNSAWEKFISAQTAGRLLPGEALLAPARRRMENRNKEFLDRMAFYYGPAAAERCGDILQQALKNFEQAMKQAPSEEDLSAQMENIRLDTTRQIRSVLATQSDPLGVTPQQTISQIRSGGIAAQQVLEEQIEDLYGKDAVLQARKTFKNIWKEMESRLQENARLSQKKAALARLNEAYKQEILASQKRWNENWRRRGPDPYWQASR